MLSSRARVALLGVVALLGSLLVLVVAPSSPAQTADGRGLVTGVVKFPQGDHPKVKVQWFDRDWNYLGRKRAGAGSYALNLPPGTYRVQFVDQRPAYNVKKYAKTTVLVRVRAGNPTIRNVTMKPGGFITGTVRTGDGRPAGNARVVAANQNEQSFETTANAQGEYAVGGLPLGKYSVFTWDRRKRWVAKSEWAGSIKPRNGRNVRIRLTRPAGALRVLLFTPDGALGGRTAVTITSRASGQWWTATARNGTAVFQGLYPGRYRLKFDGHGRWLARTGAVQVAKVRPNRTVIGKFKITRRGGWITGTVVDNAQPELPARGIAGVKVVLRTSTGAELAGATTNANGGFTLSGPLTTRTGMRIDVTPQNGADTFGQGQQWCLFTTGTRTPVSVTTGRQNAIGQVPLPRSTASGQPDRCRVS